MALSLHEVSILPFIRGLKTISAILEKARQHATPHESTLIEARLIADMGALPYQIQRISDTAKGCAVRVGHATPVAMADTETTFPALQERIARTIAVLETVDPKAMAGMEEAEVVMRLRGGDKTFTGRSYVLGFAVPNFYFHMCMAYAILRKEGVDVGKNDYLGV